MSLERRTPLKRTNLKRKPKRSTTRGDLALAWYREVTAVHGEHRGRCVMCGKGKRDARIQAHHPVRQQVIDRTYRNGALWSHELEAWVPAPYESDATREPEELRWDPSNGVPLCTDCHEAHTNKSRKVPFEVLGDGPRYFALVHRDRFGTNFEIELEHQHPRGLAPLRKPVRVAGCVIVKRELRHG